MVRIGFTQVLGSIVSIAWYMNYVVIFMQVKNFLTGLTVDQATQFVIQVIIGFFQPVTFFGFSVPVGLMLVIAFILGTMWERD